MAEGSKAPPSLEEAVASDRRGFYYGGSDYRDMGARRRVRSQDSGEFERLLSHQRDRSRTLGTDRECECG